MEEHDNSIVPVDTTGKELSVNTVDLNKESLELINKIIAEQSVEKTKDLTYLFNINQNKKTMVRVNKLSDLLDVITEQALARFSAKPDEISNKDLMDGLKVVQDLIERGQKQVTEVNDTPLIQINQQNNEVNFHGNSGGNMNRESRERVKNAVLQLLNGVASQQNKNNDSIIEVNVETNIEDSDTNEQVSENNDIIELKGYDDDD